MKFEEKLKGYLTETRVGKEVEVETYKFIFGGEDCHYTGELISGSRIIEKMADITSAFIARREGGTSNLLAHIDADILYSCHVGDCMECVCRIYEEGRRSRKVEFELYMLEQYDKRRDFFEMIEPTLTARGILTHVLGAVPHV